LIIELILIATGSIRALKSAWKSFKIEFNEIEENLSITKDEIMEELKLASEQTTHDFRQLLTAESEENKLFRQKEVAEMTNNEDFRSQQSLTLLQNQTRQVQKIKKEEGG
jgi:hypothetical protein